MCTHILYRQLSHSLEQAGTMNSWWLRRSCTESKALLLFSSHYPVLSATFLESIATLKTTGGELTKLRTITIHSRTKNFFCLFNHHCRKQNKTKQNNKLFLGWAFKNLKMHDSSLAHYVLYQFIVIYQVFHLFKLGEVRSNLVLINRRK